MSWIPDATREFAWGHTWKLYAEGKYFAIFKVPPRTEYSAYQASRYYYGVHYIMIRKQPGVSHWYKVVWEGRLSRQGKADLAARLLFEDNKAEENMLATCSECGWCEDMILDGKVAWMYCAFHEGTMIFRPHQPQLWCRLPDSAVLRKEGIALRRTREES